MTDACADRSRSCHEPLLGTASQARRWLLLEQPGSWGRDAITSSSLPPEISAQLTRLAEQLPARVLLLRRPGGGAPADGRRSLYVGHSSPLGPSWLEHLELDSVLDLLTLSLEPLARGRSVGGTPVTDPIYLVCTNGKHDPCCARYGLPIARELTGVVGERVWECSHVGGDRFAGNLVCLPDGVFYGRLDPPQARRAVAAHEAGRLLLDHWRGRSALPFAVQAGEAMARAALDVEALDDLRVVEASRSGAQHTVRFALRDGGPVVVTLREARDPDRRSLICGGPDVGPPTYELISIEH